MPMEIPVQVGKFANAFPLPTGRIGCGIIKFTMSAVLLLPSALPLVYPAQGGKA